MCVRNLAGPLNSAAYATWDDAPGRDFARRGRGDAKGGEGHQRRRRRGEEPAEAARGRRGCRWARPRPQRPPVTARSAGAAPLRGSPWQLSPPPSHGTQATAWDAHGHTDIMGTCPAPRWRRRRELSAPGRSCAGGRAAPPAPVRQLRSSGGAAGMDFGPLLLPGASNGGRDDERGIRKVDTVSSDPTGNLLSSV
ncbi:unnamed protein product [Prorocentrum cordatum]|uniref:Subtilisin n=1 Tax=Prorocentrum cordatum TaxID=2364126 RepID=A0ABN9SAD9_9DINO|nr:unnamed protein product [Polarella glacialis]